MISSVASPYDTAQEVELSTNEAEGTIYYTDDGTTRPLLTLIALCILRDYSAKPSNTCIKAVYVAAGKTNSIFEIEY